MSHGYIGCFTSTVLFDIVVCIIWDKLLLVHALYTNIDMCYNMCVFDDRPAQPVECPECGRMFKNNKALNGHMRLHGGFDWTKRVWLQKHVHVYTCTCTYVHVQT